MQCHNLDTLGIICRSLDDLALMRAALLVQPRRPVDRASDAPRIGFCRTPAWDHADADTQALLERTAERLAAAGAAVKDVTPDAGRHPRAPASHLRIRGGAQLRLRIRGARRQAQSGIARRAADARPRHCRSPPISRRSRPRRCSAAISTMYSPNSMCCWRQVRSARRPRGLDSTGDARFNAIWTLAWTPCVTLPAGSGGKGLPLGRPAGRRALWRRGVARRRRLGRSPARLNRRRLPRGVPRHAFCGLTAYRRRRDDL